MVFYSFLWINYQIEGISLYQKHVLNEASLQDLPFNETIQYFKKNSFKGSISGRANQGHDIIGKNTFFKHYTYISAFFLTAILLCIKLIKKEAKNIFIVLYALLIIYFSFFLFYLPSIVNKIIFVIFVLYGIFEILKSRRVKIFVITILLLASFFTFKDRVVRLYKDLDKWEFVSTRHRDYDGRQVIDYLRYTLIECSFEKIINEPILGVGLGDYQNYLTKCIKSKDVRNKIDLQKEYNTHSQFLHFFLVGGILNFFLFLLFLFFFVRLATKYRNIELALFVLLIASNLSFENMLNRIWGVMFIIIFLMLFPDWSLVINSNKQNK
jgi:hypothetical protein